MGDIPTQAPGGRVVHGDIDIRVDRDARWYYHGSPIGRKELICLFSSMLRRNQAGDYWLVTPTEAGRIEVEDAPFLAVEVFQVDGDHPIRVAVNSETAEPSPYVGLGNGIEARVARPAYYHPVELGVEETFDGERVFGVWSARAFFAMGHLDR